MTTDTPLNEDPTYYNNTATSMADIVADGNGPAELARRINNMQKRVTFTPHLYWMNGSTPTEINYGTAGTVSRQGWYRDDGLKVQGVMMFRIGTDATLGTAGNALVYGLPVPADPNLANGDAVKIGTGTIGCRLTRHKVAQCHLGNGSTYNIGTHGYFVDPLADFGLMLNNTPVLAGSGGPPATGTQVLALNPNGSWTDGWNNFHILFDYFKA